MGTYNKALWRTRWRSRSGTVAGLVALLYLAQGTASAEDVAYKILPGDSLSVQVFGDQQTTTPAATVVTPDGDIVYPLIGRVHVAGLTADEASKTLTKRLSLYVKHPSVTVGVVQGSMEILVLGNVKTPGKYTLKTGEHLADAIAAAGGLGPTDGDYPTARISVGTQLVQSVSLQKLLHDGDSSLNVALGNDSVVYVPSPAMIKVRVVGAVDHPGDIEIGENDRLSLAIAKAGDSANAHADLNRIVVTRPEPNGTSKSFTVNLYDELEKGNMSADPVLQKGDVVFVPQTKATSSAAEGIMMSLRRFVLPWW
jgi:polysaccharide export outer membrane protein